MSNGKIRQSKWKERKASTLDMFYINVNGLDVGTLAELRILAEKKNPALILLGEPKLRRDKLHGKKEISGYKQIANERGDEDRAGGGLMAYWREDLAVHPHYMEVQDKYKDYDTERQWLMLGNNS